MFDETLVLYCILKWDLNSFYYLQMTICLYYTDTLMNTMPRSLYMWELEKYSNECKFEVKWFDDQRQHDNVLEGLHLCVEYLYEPQCTSSFI